MNNNIKSNQKNISSNEFFKSKIFVCSNNFFLNYYKIYIILSNILFRDNYKFLLYIKTQFSKCFFLFCNIVLIN